MLVRHHHHFDDELCPLHSLLDQLGVTAMRGGRVDGDKGGVKEPSLRHS